MEQKMYWKVLNFFSEIKSVDITWDLFFTEELYFKEDIYKCIFKIILFNP